VKIEMGEGFAVKIHCFVAAKHHRRAKLQYPCIGQRFDDDFDADAIEIATAKSNNWFLYFAHDCECTAKPDAHSPVA
jgi:hypothetical protein